MNKAKYVSDKSNWGRNDYWATPAEFMKTFGDCEDYAIIKYLSLRRLGFKENELHVVAVKDLNLKEGHAVLIVFWKDQKSGKKRSLLLDNQIKKVVDARKVRHYKPVFSINKKNWWRHRS
jgi:predicted transglutaminase-like cysteine proteinase